MYKNKKERRLIIMARIATHNGTQVAREHNIRNPKVVSKEKHIDPNGHSEIWLDETPRAAYERLFGSAVRKYNAKQKRKDRQIDDYYKKICNDKKKNPVYEMIVGVYDKNISAETKREILKEFTDNWKERNPNLELIGAYFHYDEPGADIHLHADYIPIVRNCSRGLETQTALSKALEQQGIVPGKTMSETAQILWEAKENAYLESLCNARGIEVEHPQKGKKVHHMETDIFKLTEEINGLKDKVDMLQKDVVEWTAEKDLVELEAKEVQKRIDEVKEKVDAVEKTFVANLPILDRFRHYVEEQKYIPRKWKDIILNLVDSFEREEKQRYVNLKAWIAPKGKTDTFIKEKRNGFDDVDR